MHQVILYEVMSVCDGERTPAETTVSGQQSFTCAAASTHCLASNGPRLQQMSPSPAAHSPCTLFSLVSQGQAKR